MHYLRGGETGEDDTKKGLEEGLSVTKRVQSCHGDTVRWVQVGLERQGFIFGLC